MQLIDELLYADKVLAEYGLPLVGIEWCFCHQCGRSYITVVANIGDNVFFRPVLPYIIDEYYSLDILKPSLHINFNVPRAVSRSYAFSTSDNSS